MDIEQMILDHSYHAKYFKVMEQAREVADKEMTLADFSELLKDSLAVFHSTSVQGLVLFVQGTTFRARNADGIGAVLCTTEGCKRAPLCNELKCAGCKGVTESVHTTKRKESPVEVARPAKLPKQPMSSSAIPVRSAIQTQIPSFYGSSKSIGKPVGTAACGHSFKNLVEEPKIVQSHVVAKQFAITNDLGKKSDPVNISGSMKKSKLVKSPVTMSASFKSPVKNQVLFKDSVKQATASKSLSNELAFFREPKGREKKSEPLHTLMSGVLKSPSKTLSSSLNRPILSTSVSATSTDIQKGLKELKKSALEIKMCASQLVDD